MDSPTERRNVICFWLLSLHGESAYSSTGSPGAELTSRTSSVPPPCELGNRRGPERQTANPCSDKTAVSEADYESSMKTTHELGDVEDVWNGLDG